MIEAKDLRIGNVVNDYMKVVGIMYQYGTDEYLIYIQKIGTLFIYKYKEEEIFPIKLTSEILDKCGFIRSGSEIERVFLKDIYSIWEDTKWNFAVDVDENSVEIISKPQYLHQLQNLYYALTNEELQIKNLTNEQRQ